MTFAVVAYNQERYVEQAVKGALAQTVPVEILLSDDFSDDRTFEIMSSLATQYSGPHKVALNRNERNLGWAGHLNRIGELASGSVIILAAGDDISEPTRAERIGAEFARDERVKAVVSSYSVIDERGAETGKVILPPDFVAFTNVETVAKSGGWVQMGAAFAYHRDCFIKPGPIPDEILCEDRLLSLRAAALGKIGHVREPLVRHRRHAESATAVGSFRDPQYEAMHQRVLMDELDWMRGNGFLDAKVFVKARRGVSRYVAHYRRLERLGGGLVARVYSAFYNHEKSARRIGLRLQTIARSALGSIGFRRSKA